MLDLNSHVEGEEKFVPLKQTCKMCSFSLHIFAIPQGIDSDNLMEQTLFTVGHCGPFYPKQYIGHLSYTFYEQVLSLEMKPVTLVSPWC